MSKKFRYFFPLLPIFIGIAMIVSCKKKTPEDIGLPYLPTGDLLNANFTDTFSLITHTCKGDSIKTNYANPSLLGTMNDPIFGITTASIFTQIEPSRYIPSFGTVGSLDSVVLSLRFYGTKPYYGSLATEKFEVYQLSDTMNIATPYYSNKSKPYSTLLGSAYIQPDVTDSIIVGATTSKTPPQLRIRLNKNFFQSFFDSTKYTDFTTFQNFFNGIYIRTNSGPATGPGAILYIDLTNTLYSRLTMYFKSSLKPVSAGPLGADTSFAFNITSASCAHFSHFTHDYSTYGAQDLNYQINIYKDTMIQEDHVYVQPMAGVRTKITFPYLKHFFNDGKKVINKAELILKVEPQSIAGADTIFVPHPQLVATIADTVALIMPDYFEGSGYFGGFYDATNKEYRFNIARYLQQVLTDKRKNEGLYIMATSSSVYANRVQLIGGRKTLNGRMRLKVTYSPVK